MKYFPLLWVLLLVGCAKSPGYHIGPSEVIFVTRDAAGYSQTHPMKDADPSSFSVIQEPFGKDKARVFYQGQVLEGVVPESFKILQDNYYSTDGKLVFAGRHLLTDDAANFAILDKSYSKDSEKVFYLGKLAEGAQAQSFQIFDSPGSYAKDDNLAFREGQLIREADGSTFEPVNYYYSKDKTQVFYTQEPLKGADPTTFTAEPKRQLGRDASHVWYLDFLLEELDGNQAQILDGLYAKDAQSVYFGNRKIDEADAPSFETYTENGTIYGKDKNGIYSAGRRR